MQLRLIVLATSVARPRPDAIVCATVHKAFLCNRAVAVPHPQSWNSSLSTRTYQVLLHFYVYRVRLRASLPSLCATARSSDQYRQRGLAFVLDVTLPPEGKSTAFETGNIGAMSC